MALPWIVRAVRGTDRITVTDHHFDTKREALAFLRSLYLGEKPTISVPESRVYVVYPKPHKA